MSYRKSAFLTTLLLASLSPFLAPTPARAAEDDPVEVRRVRKMVENEKQVILFFAHPTVSFQSLRYDGFRPLKDGFTVTYTFNWEGTSGEGYSELIFVCDRNGKLDFIRPGDTSAVFFKPFVASNLVVTLLKDELRNEPRLQDDREVMRLLEKDAKAVLESYLRRDVEALQSLLKAAMKLR